jgi:hypothetical protein
VIDSQSFEISIHKLFNIFIFSCLRCKQEITKNKIPMMKN